MEGVVVHAEHIYRETPIVATVSVVILTVCFLIWVAYQTIKCFKNKNDDRLELASTLIVAIAILVPLNVGMIGSSCTVRNDLIVTIDDTVLFNEFYEHYEVVSQDDKLYTVRELSIEDTKSEEVGDNE